MRYRSLLCGFAFLLAGLLFATPVQAQQFNDTDDLSDIRGALKTVGKRYASNYVQPVTDAFGAGLGAGLFRSADVGNSLIPGLPVNVYLGVSVSGSLTSSMKTSFVPQSEPVNITLPDGSTTQGTLTFSPSGENVPTVLGDTDPAGNPSIELKYNGVNGNTQTETLGQAPQGLLDTPIAPIVVPQIAIGSVAGTDFQVRYFPKTSLSSGGGSYGKVGLFGIAVRHDIDQWIPGPFPLDLAVQGAWNQFSLESEDPRISNSGYKEIFSGSGWAFNVQASKGVPVIPLKFYGGVQYERFSADYSYTLQPPGSDVTSEITFEQDAQTSVRGLAGLTLTFAVVRFNVDYAITNGPNVVTTGLGVRL